MKTRSNTIAISIIAFLVGTGIGVVAKHRSAETTTAAGTTRLRGAAAIARVGSSSTEEPHDLKALLRWKFKQTAGFNEDSAIVERMNPGEIRELMAGLIADLIAPDPPIDDNARRALRASLQAAARELFHREGDEALRWADAAASGKGREELLGAMIVAAVMDSPGIAKPWIERYLIDFGKGRQFEFQVAAGRGATARGAEDLVKLKETLGELAMPVPVGPLPEGFDFPLMMDNFKAGEPEIREAMQLWAARDRDAAWKEIRKISEKDPLQSALLVGAVFSGMAVGGNEREAIRWIMPKLDELPMERRDWAMNSLFADNDNARAAITDIMREIPREEDRAAVADGLIIPGGNETVALSAIRAIGGEEAQKQAILKSLESWRGDGSFAEPGAPILTKRDYYTSLIYKLGFSEESRQEVEAMFPK